MESFVLFLFLSLIFFYNATGSPLQMSKVADLNVGRYNLGCVLINNRLFALGGQVNETHSLNSVETFQAGSNASWNHSPDMITSRSMGTYVTVSDRWIIAAGGSNKNVEVFDSKSLLWNSSTPLTTARAGAFGIISENATLLAIVGGDTDGASSYEIATIDQQNGTLVLGTFVFRDYLPASIANAMTGSHVQITSNAVYFIGPNSVHSVLISSFFGDLKSAVVTNETSLPYKLNSPSSSMFDGRMFVFGGYSINDDSSRTYSSQILSYVNSWKTQNVSLENNFAQSCAVTNMGGVYIIGGYRLTMENGNSVGLVSSQVQLMSFPSSHPSGGDDDEGLPNGAIAGIAIGSLVLVFIGIGCIYIIMRHKKNAKYSSLG